MTPAATPTYRHPRTEAWERLDGSFEVRVLEPSPPAVHADPWFADDPVARGDVPDGRRLVSPVSNGDLRWDDLCADDPDLAGWCADRWLGGWRRLRPLPSDFATARLDLHRLGFYALSPAREAANGKIGLRYTQGGFGTPFFADDRQLRVEGTWLVDQRGPTVEAVPITTLATACEVAGVRLRTEHEFDAPAAGDPQRPLDIDGASVAALGDWYGFVTSMLEELRTGADPSAQPSRVQLWPEHFDPAVEIGDQRAGVRAAYGGSPGDEHHPEPYLYVSPWQQPPNDPFWNAPGFGGALLPHVELLEVADQRRAALDFFAAGLRLLSSR